jgi:hypothetical protein
MSPLIPGSPITIEVTDCGLRPVQVTNAVGPELNDFAATEVLTRYLYVHVGCYKASVEKRDAFYGESPASILVLTAGQPET